MDDTQSFAETIGEFVQAVAAKSDERRASRRFEYDEVQSVAPYDGKQLPTGGMFRKVRCYDLSTGGISFVWPQVPDFQRVVIRLAAARRVMYVDARVMRHKPLDESDHRFLVGCKFLDRVRITM